MPANLPVFPVAGGLPVLLAQGGAALVAPGGLDQMAKPVNPVANVPGAKMAQNFANAPAGGAPAAPAEATTTAAPAAASGLQAQLIKYGPSYFLMALLICLGVFIIARPYSIPEDKIKD
jgi:hypothetical protein